MKHFLKIYLIISFSIFNINQVSAFEKDSILSYREGSPHCLTVLFKKNKQYFKAEQYGYNSPRLNYRWDVESRKVEVFGSYLYFFADSLSKYFLEQCNDYHLYEFDSDEHNLKIIQFKGTKRHGLFEWYTYENLPQTWDAYGKFYSQSLKPMGAWQEYTQYPSSLLSRGKYTNSKKVGLWEENVWRHDYLWYVPFKMESIGYNDHSSISLSIFYEIIPCIIVLLIYWLGSFLMKKYGLYNKYYYSLGVLSPFLLIAIPFASFILHIFLLFGLSIYHLFNYKRYKLNLIVILFVIAVLLGLVLLLLISAAGSSAAAGAL